MRIITLTEQNPIFVQNIGIDAIGVGIANYSAWPVYVRIGALDTPTVETSSFIVPAGNSINIPVTGLPNTSLFGLVLATDTDTFGNVVGTPSATVVFYAEGEIPPNFGQAPSFNFGETRRSDSEEFDLNSGNSYTQEIVIDTFTAKQIAVFISVPYLSTNIVYGDLSVEYPELGVGFVVGLNRNSAASYYVFPVLSPTMRFTLDSSIIAGSPVAIAGTFIYNLSGDPASIDMFSSEVVDTITDNYTTADVPIDTTNVFDITNEYDGYIIRVKRLYVNLETTTANNDLEVVAEYDGDQVAFVASSDAGNATEYLDDICVILSGKTLTVDITNVPDTAGYSADITIIYEYVLITEAF